MFVSSEYQVVYLPPRCVKSHHRACQNECASDRGRYVAYAGRLLRRGKKIETRNPASRQFQLVKIIKYKQASFGLQMEIRLRFVSDFDIRI
jgi:hypothetical protein